MSNTQAVHGDMFGATKSLEEMNAKKNSSDFHIVNLEDMCNLRSLTTSSNSRNLDHQKLQKLQHFWP